MKAARSCLTGEVVTAADGSFAGFRGTAEPKDAAPEAQASRAAAISTTRSTKSCARRSTGSSRAPSASSSAPTGRLRSDYASYGSDIAAAARHLLSVVRGMSEDLEPGQRADRPDRARRRSRGHARIAGRGARVTIELEQRRAASRERAGAGGDPDPRQPHRQRDPLFARGQDGPVCRSRAPTGSASVAVSDEGPGIARGRPAAHFRALRARPSTRRRHRARPRDLAPARAVDGRRCDARQRAGRGRALHA